MAAESVSRFRVRAAAQYLGISPRSLNDRTWRIRHRIPAFKIGKTLLFDRAQLDAWLDQHREMPIEG